MLFKIEAFFVFKQNFFYFRPDMRETKIDNHHSIECHSVETSTMIEQTDINSNKNDVILPFGNMFMCFIRLKYVLVHSCDEYRK